MSEEHKPSKAKVEVSNKSLKTVKDMLNLPYSEFVSMLKDHAKDPKVAAILRLGIKDGIPTDEKVIVTEHKFKVKNLIPTQNQIGLADSLAWVAKNKPEILEPIIKGDTSMFDNIRILTANGKYIIDGHHRWSQIFFLNPEAVIPAINLEISGIKDPEELLRVIQMAIAATYKKVVTKDANSKTDIFNEDVMSREKIKEQLPEILGDDALEICRKAFGLKTKQETVERLTKNIEKVKRYKPKSSPQRSSMPQPSDSAKAVGKPESDVKGLPSDFIDTLKSGIINFKEPLIHNKTVAIKERLLSYDEFFLNEKMDNREMNRINRFLNTIDKEDMDNDSIVKSGSLFKIASDMADELDIDIEDAIAAIKLYNKNKQQHVNYSYFNYHTIESLGKEMNETRINYVKDKDSTLHGAGHPDFRGNFEIPEVASTYILYKLDDWDKDFVKNVKLKSDEKIFRVQTDRMKRHGIMPLVKINLKNGMIYFNQQDAEDEEKVQFETKGIKAIFLNLKMPDKFIGPELDQPVWIED